MADPEDGGFEFVMQNPNDNVSRETRTRIRRQAMKAVGATRRKPVLLRSSSSGMAIRDPVRRDQRSLGPPPSMPLSGLELLVRDRGLDPMDLSALTSIHIGAM